MEPQWDRLGAAVRHRRSSQGWTQDEVFERGGPSDTLQSDIEQGRWRPTRSVKGTLQKIDTGMRWAPGSASQLLDGGDPTPLEDSPAAEPQPTPAPTPPANDGDTDPVAELGETVADNWTAAGELVDAVLRSNPTDELLEASGRAVFLLSGYLIIRILNSGHQTELEPLLARIYSEREALFRRLQQITPGIPRTPWVTTKGNDDDVETAPEPDAPLARAEGEEVKLPDDPQRRPRTGTLGDHLFGPSASNDAIHRRQ